MNDQNRNWPENESAWKSPWLRGIIAFMALFVSVNIFMVWTAFSTKPNLVTEDYYKRGQSFTERTKLKNKGKALHDWKFNLTYPEITMGTPALFQLSISHQQNTITPDIVNLFAYRPADSNKDFKVIMNANPDGGHSANITFTEQGYWDVIVVVEQEGYETDYAERIRVKSH